jgi:hypothetical protein
MKVSYDDRTDTLSVILKDHIPVAESERRDEKEEMGSL